MTSSPSNHVPSDHAVDDTVHTIHVQPEEAGTRLDKYLTEALSDKTGADKTANADGSASLSRARIRLLLEEGRIELVSAKGAKAANDASAKVKAGETYRITVPAPKPAKPQGQAIPLDIHYEDADLIVVMKQAGLVVHPAPGNPDMTLVNALIAHCGDSLSGIGGERRPGIVHRLDKDTSGLMVVAKTDRAHQGLAEQFAAHGRDGRLTRAYTALVWGEPRPRHGTIEANIDRSRHNRLKMAVTKTAGREAITHYEVLESFGEPPLVSLVECRLETGRTHQIRVHMASVGHPVLGDPTYGTGMKTRKSRLPEEAQGALETLGRQALHAHHLGFAHPVTGEPLAFDAPLPPNMEALLSTLELL